MQSLSVHRLACVVNGAVMMRMATIASLMLLFIIILLFLFTFVLLALSLLLMIMRANGLSVGFIFNNSFDKC